MDIKAQRKVERAKYEKIYSMKFVPGTNRKYSMSQYRQDDYRRYLKGIAHENYKFLLDVGCGKFTSGSIAKELGYTEVMGVEICRNIVLKDVMLVEGAHELPFVDGSFDVVTCIDVMEHIIESDVPAVLTELFRVTKHRTYITISHKEGAGPVKQRGHITVYPREWWVEEIHKVQPANSTLNIHTTDHIRPVKLPLSLVEVVKW